MSNHLAIATVTAGLCRTIQDALIRDEAADSATGPSVFTLRPQDVQNNGDRTGVNIFLYQISPNAALRNADLPTRTSEGRALQRPRIALNLHYLLSFFGDDGELVPQRLMGTTVRALHASPVLTHESILATLGEDRYAYLAGSDLHREVEQVKLVPLSLSLEELSKLWSVFFQSPYVLSVAYLGTVVLIDGDLSPQPALPVRERRIFGAAGARPRIRKVRSAERDSVQVEFGWEVVVEGEHLGGQGAQLFVGDVEVSFEPVAAGELRAVLDATDLRAGVNPVRVVLPSPAAANGAGVRLESNVGALVLVPRVDESRLTADAGPDPGSGVLDGVLHVGVEPAVRPGQRVSAVLHGTGPDDPSYVFEAEPVPEPATTAQVPFTGVRAGRYLVRLNVDGAESRLRAADPPPAPYTAPAVEIVPGLPLMFAADIDLESTPTRRRARVTVRDTAGDPVEDAEVSAVWRLADGGEVTESETTRSDGVTGRFSIRRSEGPVEFAVIGIEREGYRFAPALSAEPVPIED